MTRKKKSTPSKRRSSPKSKVRKGADGRLKRFLKAFSVSAVTAFSIASCAFNPQLRDDLPFALPQIDWLHSAPSFSGTPSPAGLAQTSFAQCPQFFPRKQPPVVPGKPALRELCFTSFAILHDGATKTPVFVAEKLDRRSLQAAQDIRRTDRFYPEARLPRAERAELEDYRGSGYSRGHMAPAGNMASDEAMAQSFSLANMVPQDQRHNGGPWNRIEQDTRKYVMRAKGSVYVFTGPVYHERTRSIGPGKVGVPSHLFKLVYDVESGRSWVHWHENGPTAKVGPPISYEEFVRRTNLRLLPASQG